MRGLHASFLAVVLFPSLASAHSVWDGDFLRLDWNGFTSQTSGISHLPYDVPFIDPTALLGAGLIRLEWNAQLGQTITFNAHNRLFWRVSSAPTGANVGLGVSDPPPRTVDLRTEFISEDNQLFEHDLDRLSIGWMTPLGDLMLGRQAITWGVGTTIPVMDFWTQLSPFDLDTTQKRGVDAARLLTYVDDLEIDVLVVDRGTLEDLSGGVRVSWMGSTADYHGAIARSYDRVWGAMGVAADLGSWRAHSELAIPFRPEAGQLGYPRSTVGSLWTDGTWAFGGDYHFNGFGERDYLISAAQAEVQRGESFLLGRHYASLHGMWTDQELTLSVVAIGNLVDPSMLLTPSLVYSVGDAVQLRLSGFFGFGEKPRIQGLSFELPSEFGAYGYAGFTEVHVYF